MREPPRVFLWAPEFGERAGGVQQYTREVMRAVAEIVGPARMHGLSYLNSESSVVEPWMFECVSVAKYPRWFRGVAFTLAALDQCRRWRPDLILSTFPRFAPAGRLCADTFDISFVTAAHGVEVWGRLGSILRHSLAASDRILSVSRRTRDRLIAENGISPDRISIVPNCVNGDRFRPGAVPTELRERFGIRPDSRVLLSAARLDESERGKGVENVIAVLPRLRDRISGLRYVVVGDGSDRQRLERLATEAGVADLVRFAGRVSNEELPDFYRMCDCFVLPSAKEGFGIVFLEAMATGKPVIAGNKDGAADPLCDGELGWLVDPGSPDAIRDALIEALEDTRENDQRCDPVFLRSEALARFGRDVLRDNLRAMIAEMTKE